MNGNAHTGMKQIKIERLKTAMSQIDFFTSSDENLFSW